jgi:glutathione S-transferase
MIVLHTIPGAWGLTSLSPFCTKLETWLRMADLPFQARPADPRRAPKGKCPFVESEGCLIGDSQLIIHQLSAQSGVTLDAWLTPTQHHAGHALRRMLEEGTYFGLGHARWQHEQGWQHYRHAFRAMMPPLVRDVVPRLIRRGMVKALRAQGTGRHGFTEIQAMMRADMEALAAQLGGQDFLFGAQPCSYDAVAYAFVDGFLGFPVPSPAGDWVRAHAPPVAYHARIRERWYPQGPSLRALRVPTTVS